MLHDSKHGRIVSVQDSTFVVDVLGERSSEEAAQHVVEHSVLTEGVAAMEALQGGSIAEADPATQIVDAIAGKLTAYRSAMAALAVEEQSLAQQIGRARYAGVRCGDASRRYIFPAHSRRGRKGVSV